MFDLAHEPARRLTSLLAQAQDADPQRTPTAELRVLAGDLDVAWQHAQQYAGRLGYDALGGGQDDARQAAGLARKAAAAGVGEHERAVLLCKVKAILDTMQLVVPQPMAQQIEAAMTAEITAGD